MPVIAMARVQLHHPRRRSPGRPTFMETPTWCDFRLHRRIPGIRHIYDRLDDARRQRDRLSAELGRIAAELDEVTCVRDRFDRSKRPIETSFEQDDPFGRWVHQFRTVLTELESAALPPTPAVATQNPRDAGDDRTITKRVIAAYRHCSLERTGTFRLILGGCLFRSEAGRA